MMKQTFLALAVALPLAATEMPPMVASGPVYYDDVTYAYGPAAPAYSYAPAATAPLAPAPASQSRGEIVLNAYTSNYQVRGMGVTNFLSNCGYSSLYGSWVLPNRNLFNRGIHQRVSGTWGAIWGADKELGDTPQVNLNYAIGKEVLPNLTLEAGYSIRRGGLEGFMARITGCSHRIAQDLNLTLRFNDHQRGFFGHAIWGVGFQGLTGSYFDVEGGWRFMDVLARPGYSVSNYGADMELSAGVSSSFGYWGGGAEGVDAYRLRAALLPYSHKGTFGRDARLSFTPWVQCSWTGHNASKIDRRVHCGPADHFQLTAGLDVAWRF